MQYIELRTDSRVTPTAEIRASILTSAYGDWEEDEDETVKQLEAYTAALFGKEDAAFVVSGVFGNQCSILTATSPGQELFLNEKSHNVKHQNGAFGLISKVVTRTLDCPEGYITPQILTKVLRKKTQGAVIMEFPTFGGAVQPLESLRECSEIAKSKGIHVHIDGARVFSGLAELKITPQQFARNASSLSFCLSKGLCAPIGSVVVGDKDFIARFKANRKVLGGEITKPGVAAGAGLLALKTMIPEIAKDNEIAKLLAERMTELKWLTIAAPVQTNMVFFRITDPEVKTAALSAFLFEKNIRSYMIENTILRFVVHFYIREAQIQKVMSALLSYKPSPTNNPDI